MNNKKLFKVVVVLIPLVVISFIFKDKTNFNLEENKINEEISVKVLVNDKVETLELEEYIVGVVAAEMPASFEMEALKAQAVASRSYALYRKNKNNSNAYDLIGDINGQVYITKDEMHDKWGRDFDKYYDRVKNAVDETAYEVATYNGDIIEALYFSMSAGTTQDVASVFNESHDYLVSVSSEYDNASIKSYEVVNTFEHKDIINKLDLTCNKVSLDSIRYNDNGYVNNIELCGKKIEGNDFRKRLALRSANFKIDIENNITITTYGNGHGVGMSQYGANGYAKNGYNYKEIIKHYYKNTDIIKIK